MLISSTPIDPDRVILVPRIFDNITDQLQSALIRTLDHAERADFCVGYFNLRGWRLLSPHIESWRGDESSRVRPPSSFHRPAHNGYAPHPGTTFNSATDAGSTTYPGNTYYDTHVIDDYFFTYITAGLLSATNPTFPDPGLSITVIGDFSLEDVPAPPGPPSPLCLNMSHNPSQPSIH
jgi:hypothetical protein